MGDVSARLVHRVSNPTLVCGQPHESRRVFIRPAYLNSKKKSIDFRDNSIKKVIINRTALENDHVP